MIIDLLFFPLWLRGKGMRVVFNIPYRWSIFREKPFSVLLAGLSLLLEPCTTFSMEEGMPYHSCLHALLENNYISPFPFIFFCFNDSLLSQMVNFYMSSTKKWKHAFNSLCVGPYLFCYFPCFSVMSFHKINAFISIIFSKLCQVAIVNVLNAESNLSYQTLYSTLFICNFCS